MPTRRDCLTSSAALAASALLPRLAAAQPADVIKHAIPKTGEQIPIIGLGSSATFGQIARSADVTPLKDVLQTLVDAGGSVFDTAPSYGASEEVAGRLVNELGVRDRVFWATKLNVLGGRRGGGGTATADPAAARAAGRDLVPALRRRDHRLDPGAQRRRHPDAARHPQRI